MTDFLLELRSEEIPARMQDKARDDLARLFAAELDKAGLKAESLSTLSTPRRLALIAKGLPLETQAVSEETKGPKVGAPPQALEGFLRKTGLTQDQLVERDGVYFAVIEKPGRPTSEILKRAIFAITSSFPWPKSMRWGVQSSSTASLRWVRPLQGIVAIFGDDVVEFELNSHADVYANAQGDIRIEQVSKGIRSSRETMGHRFHHSGPVTIGNAADYAMKLRAAHVIVDQEERRSIIRAGAEKAAADAGLVLVHDEGLVNENSGLTEWPVPMLGRFDPAFLAVPEEVIQLTARVNQKYFICRDAGGKLANAFVCTANIVARDGGASIVAGNEKVLAARLSDAKFFWEQDLKIPLEDQAQKLSQIVFHEKLGTVADKVERVAKLARWLVTSGVIPAKAGIHEHSGSSNGATASNSETLDSRLRGNDEDVEALATLAERAARLCKADLVTGMVGEFPELQGIMGGYYARAQGESDAVADAIRDHYKPVGQGGDVPTAPVTVAVSLADKLDTLFGFFALEQYPTGSKDPFALRRTAIGICNLIIDNNLRLPLTRLMRVAMYDLILSVSQFMVVSESYDSVDDADHFAGQAAELKIVASPADLEVYLGQLHAALFDGTAACKWFVAVQDFLADRLKVQQKEAGVRHDLIDAVFALGGEDDLVRLLARVKALQAFVGTEDGKNLLAGYKRAIGVIPAKAGIHEHPLSGEGATSSSIETLDSRLRGNDELAVETALREALDAAETKATAAIAAEDFEGAMSALASLRAPIDAFFDGVMVNDPDPAKRAFRLGMLGRFRNAVHAVADFGKIEG